MQTHTSLETHGCVCEWDGDKLTAWVSTQAVHGTREGFAQALKIPQANVRVITEFMGGGFGSKFAPDAQGLLCARLAKAANAPVKLMLDRKEEHLATGNRPSAFAKVKAGVSKDGKLTAFDAQTWGTGGAGAGSDYPLPYIYVFPNRRRVHTDVYINAGQQRAMRAPGHPQGCFVTEVLMDELADQVRMDPVEFRLKNLPALAPNAMWAKYFPMGAERIDWKRRHVTGDPTPGPIKRGLGCSANRWGGAGQGGRAHCEITADGGVVMRCGSQDIGTGNRTIMAIVVAETLGLEVRDVTIELGDSNFPFAPGSGGSTTAASVMPAMRVTAGKARDALFERIAPSLERHRQISSSSASVASMCKGSNRGVTWREACKMLGTVPVSVDGQWERGLSAGGTSGVQFAEVEVDIETGITRREEDRVRAGLRHGRRSEDRRDAVLRRHHQRRELRGLRGAHPRSQHREHGEPQHGVVPHGGAVGHSRDRRCHRRSAGARRHRHRRAAGGGHRRRHRQRDSQRDRRHRPQHSDYAGQAAHRARARGRHELKAFAYVNAANERDAVAALNAEAPPPSALARRILPMAGGMDLLGLMKDYIVSPDRIVSIRNLDQTIASASDSGLRIGAAVKLVDLAEHATVKKLFPALATAAEGVGTPQIRNMGTVGGNIMQRPRCWYFRNEEFNCLKKGGSRCFAVEGENQFHAIFGDGPCHIVHPSSLAVPVIAYGGRFRVVGPNGAREIDAGEFFQMPNVNLYGESVLQANEIITHVVLPAPGQRSASYEVRFKQSHDWPLAMASVNLDDGWAARAERASRDGRGRAGAVAGAGGRASAGGKDDHGGGCDRGGDGGAGGGEADDRQRLQDSDCEDGGEASGAQSRRSSSVESLVLPLLPSAFEGHVRWTTRNLRHRSSTTSTAATCGTRACT